MLQRNDAAQVAGELAGDADLEARALGHVDDADVCGSASSHVHIEPERWVVVVTCGRERASSASLTRLVAGAR
jgi:hypothetical protein